VTNKRYCQNCILLVPDIIYTASFIIPLYVSKVIYTAIVRDADILFIFCVLLLSLSEIKGPVFEFD